MLKLFGFPYHDAPGEAEAECAVLQQHGVVDAVLSEDVDTLMFGCGATLRNWSGEGSAGKTPTHVTVYDRETIKIENGLTPKGMILVALMSGGDYLPEGVPRCGIRTAVEAAKAGFGEDLCNLGVDDEEGLREWRERLSFELETNESGWFRRKNKSVKIPPGFPDRTVLGYYMRPAVSDQETVEKLRRKIAWNGNVDVTRLRETVRYAFEWKGKKGAAKFVRTLAPAILARKLVDAEERNKLESIVKGFHGTREHFSTGGLKELRVSFVPGEVIEVDMDAEEEDEVSEEEDDEDADVEGLRKAKDYDIFAAERIWVQDMYARRSLREMIEEWEKPKQSKSKASKKTPVKARTKTKAKTPPGSIMGYLNVSNPSSQNIIASAAKKSRNSREARESSEPSIWKDMEALSIASPKDPYEVLELEEISVAHSHSATRKPSRTRDTAEVPLPKKAVARSKTKTFKSPKKFIRHRRAEAVEDSEEDCSNLWTPPRRLYSNVSPPHGTRYSALGIYGEPLSDSLDEAPLPVSGSPYSLPDAIVLSPLPSPSPSPKFPRYETITILSSPAPASASSDPLTPYVSPPSTPSRRRKSSPIPEASRPSTPTHRHDLHISKELNTPSPAKSSPSSSNAGLSPPRTPTFEFGRLQVVDLLDDDDAGGQVDGESPVSRVLDFSPSAHLSPNITTRRKGRKLKTREPELQAAQKERVLHSPIPFPLPISRRPRATSPLRKVFSAAAETPSTVSYTEPAHEDHEEVVVGGKTAKRIVLRESLEGRWEFIEDEWSVRDGKKVWEKLEILDLTSDD